MVLFLLLPPVSEPVSFHGVFNDFFDSFTLITGLVGDDNGACAAVDGTCTFGSCASGYESAGETEDQNCYSINFVSEQENTELVGADGLNGMIVKSITGRAVEGWNCCVPIDEPPVCGEAGVCDATDTCSACPDDCDGRQADCGTGKVCEVYEGEGICEDIPISSCSNGIIESPEVCDKGDSVLNIPPNLNGQTCSDFNDYNSGTLACSATCLSFVTTGCSHIDEPEPYCGDGDVNQASEQCDGSDLNAQTCNSQGFDSGTLSCNGDCTFNMNNCVGSDCSNCITASCGECAVECYHRETADCQGIDKVTGADTFCSILGSCISRVVPKTCGSNGIDEDEECDGEDTGILKCSTLGFYTNNDLGCDSYCLIDPSTCVSVDNADEQESDESTGGSADDSSCGGIGGVCMNGCMSGYTYQSNTALDEGCQDSFDITSLVCCVEGEEVLTSPTTGDNLDISEELRKSLEEQNAQTKSSQEESRLIGILTSPKTLGSAWIVFLLSAIIIVVSAYIHKRFVKKQ